MAQPPMLRAVLAALLGLAPSPASAAVDEPLSLQGFSGLLDTPTAFTHASGSAHLLFTNQLDPRFRSADAMRTYVLSIGFLRYLEAGGRISETLPSNRRPGGLRDLSFNLKLRLPLDLLFPHFPIAVAVGTQDEGGAATHFRTRYAVLTLRAWRLAGSLGHGSGQRMNGIFGGLGLRLLSFAEALADWDAAEWNAGIRLSLPIRVFSVPLRIGGIAKTSLSHQPRHWEWAATLSVPLGLDESTQAVDGRRGGPSARPSGEVARGEAAGAPAHEAPSGTAGAGSPGAYGLLEADLVAVGLENVRAGADGDTAVVEYENGLFGRAEQDAIGVVLGRLAWRAPAEARRFAVVLRRARVAILELSGPMASLRAHFGAPGAGAGPPLERAIALRWRPRRRLAGPVANSSALHSQLVLGPGLRTFIATEVSTFEYVLSLLPEAIVTLWPGGVAYARGDIPVLWSSALSDVGALRAHRPSPRADHALLYQALPVAPGLLALAGAGVFRGDPGCVAEALWTPFGGTLALGAQAAATTRAGGAFSHALTGSARLDVVRLDAVAELRGGEFAGGELGAVASLGRWFGDTKVSFFGARAGGWLAGLEISLPLTQRREMRPGLLQIHGPRRWSYEIHSAVGSRTNPVRLAPPLAPFTPWNLETAFLDEGRLSRARVAAGLVRAARSFQRVSPIDPP